MARRPVEGIACTLRDVLPRAGPEYRATVERVWHDDEGRLLSQFAAEDGRRPLLEVWLKRV